MIRKSLSVKTTTVAIAGIAVALAAATSAFAQEAYGSRAVPAAQKLPNVMAPLSLDGVIAVRGSTFAWAFSADGFTGISHLVTFNGKSKRWFNTRAALPKTTVLTGLASVSRHAVWVTGAIGGPLFGSHEHPYLAHYFAGKLRPVDVRPFHAASLNGISMATASDAWAVGTRRVSKTGVQPLALHWNGHRWRPFSVLSEQAGLSLQSVSAIGSRTVWATAVNKAGTAEVLMFNGRHWSRSLTVPPTIELHAIAASSASNAWVVGDSSSDSGYSAHWNGKRWTSVATPKLTSQLLGVTLVGGKAWAVGEAFLSNSSDRAVPEMLVSTGHTWSRQRAPDPGASSSPQNQSTFVSISAASARFLIAVGQNGVQCVSGSGFADINTGRTWKAAPLPPKVEITGGGLLPACGG